MTMSVRAGVIAACAGIAASAAFAQQDLPSKVDLVFNRYHTTEEIQKAMADLAAAYPEICRVQKIGTSLEGRDLLVLTVGSSKGGEIDDKPAMWIDGAVHANEVQSAEAVLYTAWYLTKAYGTNKPLTELVDRCSFHLLPMVNPDSRVAWLNGPSSPHNHRSNRRPEDQDRDGVADEDGPDDLDGDGSVTQMWKHDAQGRWERDATDPRIFRRVASDKPPGGWTNLGEEGIDNDGDGLINEDPVGGDDMNRNWPAGWLPEYVQGGAGPYPFSAPETRAVGAFIEARPNIAAAQSYHNAGGMILRGPGAAFRESSYPGGDVRVYEQIARVGEQMLPYYRSMVIHKDLYTVHGGFVNWTAESLGIFSFTNELWTPAKYFQRDQANPSEEQQWLWRDRMAFGQLFTDYKEFDHPVYGKVLIGGMNKWASRNTPTFLLEEECHRNFAFTMYHADQMPRLSVLREHVEQLSGGLWSVKVEIGNSQLIPTRSEHARNRRIGVCDLLLLEPAASGTRVAAAFSLSSWLDQDPEPISHEPARIRNAGGVPGRGSVIYRFLIESAPGTSVKLLYQSPKAADLMREIELR
jgi:hypothetical protein